MAGVPDYLVFFVIDAVDDTLADEVRRRIQILAGARAWRDQPPGFFDDPEPAAESPRTTGGFLRIEADHADQDEPVSSCGLTTGSPLRGDLRAFCAAVQALSTDAEIDIELQWRELILGRVRAGVPDDGLEEALREVTGEPPAP